MGPVVATSQRGQAARRQRALTPESGGGPWNRQLARTHRSSERIAMKGTSGGLGMRPLPTIDLSKAGIDELVRKAPRPSCHRSAVIRPRRLPRHTSRGIGTIPGLATDADVHTEGIDFGAQAVRRCLP
jgi:hypothetical protein